MLNKLFKKSRYKFSDPKNTTCIVCSHIIEHQSPILFVSHDEEDGVWQFLCGAENHEIEEAKIISLFEATNIDQSINDLSEMPLGFGATRDSINDIWQTFKN